MCCAVPASRRTISVRVPHSACHRPADRCSSCGIPASTVATSPGSRCAQATASTAAAGLRLFGMADDPPGAATSTSASSVADSSTTSWATAASSPARTPHAAASSATRPRAVCHGVTGSARPSSAATAAMSSSARSAVPARVPTGPPSCTASRWCSTASRPASASSTPVSRLPQAAPKVVTSAFCRSVRPTWGVLRCSSASAARVSDTARQSSRTGPRAERATSAPALSRMSWLVAARWT